jgi:uncharacterized protein
MSTSRRNFLSSAGFAVPAAFSLSDGNRDAKPAGISSPKLVYRTLGKTGLKVTTVGFGCMITSDGSVIERAADMGINCFDTARVYQSGNCERMVGAALKSRRKNLVLSTKSLAGSKEGLLADLDTSLRELQTDYVDIWYLHSKSKPADIHDDMMEAQRIAKKAGKVRFAGVSTHGGQKELLPWVAAQNHFDVVLTTYNFTMDKAVMDAVVDSVAKAGIGVVAMKVMAGGQKPLGITPSTAQTKEILRREGGSLAALKWSLRNPNIHTTIPSMVDNDQLDDNMVAMAAPWSPVDEKILAARLEEIGPLFCRYCGSCQGQCAQGLPVSDVLRAMMYADGYGEFALGRAQFHTMPARLQAVRCGDCGDCTVKCPNGIRIVERLTRAQECFA